MSPLTASALPHCHLWLLALLSAWAVGSSSVLPPSAPTRDSLHLRWADAAFQLLQTLNCTAVLGAGAARCDQLRRVPRRQTVVYVAERPPGAQISALLPDGALTSEGELDALLVLDPFPEASWGHLVAVFNVQRRHTAGKCGPYGGTKLDTGDCISLAVKRRCLNQLSPAGSPAAPPARCQVTFLPEVRVRPLGMTPSGVTENQLHCRPLTGYGMCPRLRPLEDTADLLCEPDGEGHMSCDSPHLVETRCRLFETCDQAVLLSGGWNRQHSDQRSRLSMLHMYRMLRHAGFHKHNVKVFYANGRDNTEAGDELYPHTYLYPSAMKLGLRYHLRKLCAEPHCVDSLVLYLNSPTAQDGSMLLWDVDGDGIASRQDRYQMTELLSDLASCAARQVLILADQSFSGKLVQAVKNSQDHDNVQVVSAGGPDDYSWSGDYVRAWTTANHSNSCIKDISQALKTSSLRSQPESLAMPAAPPALTVFGAPCDISPALTEQELSRTYRGCQNLPLTVWLRGRAGRPPPASLEQLVQEDATRRRRRR